MIAQVRNALPAEAARHTPFLLSVSGRGAQEWYDNQPEFVTHCLRALPAARLFY